MGKNVSSYKFEKRKKEIARQKKQEEKRQRQLQKKQEKQPEDLSTPSDGIGAKSETPPVTPEKPSVD